MTMLEEIRDLVKNQFEWIHFSSEFEGEPNAFLMDMPADPAFAISFYQYGGEKPEETMGRGVILEYPRLQVVVRHPYTDEAIRYAYELWRFLGNIKHHTNGEGRPMTLKITSNSSPFELGPDAAGNQRIAVNFQVTKEL